MPIFGKGFESPTSRRLVADKSATDRRRRKICFRFDEMVGDQSPNSRRLVADCTVFIYTNAMHKLQEVFERAVVNIFNMEAHQMQLLPLQCGLQRLNTPSSAAWEKMQITKRGLFILLDIFSDVVWRPGISIAQQLIKSINPRF